MNYGWFLMVIIYIIRIMILSVYIYFMEIESKIFEGSFYINLWQNYSNSFCFLSQFYQLHKRAVHLTNLSVETVLVWERIRFVISLMTVQMEVMKHLVVSLLWWIIMVVLIFELFDVSTSSSKKKKKFYLHVLRFKFV